MNTVANKSRVLYLLRYLQQYSDEDHPVSTAEIRAELAEKGCPATVETLRDDIRMLREAGATQVHMRIASPPYAWPCFYGIDTGSEDQLLASGRNIEDIRDYIGADSVEYLSVGALFQASDRTELCTACFDGNYPTDLYKEINK